MSLPSMRLAAVSAGIALLLAIGIALMSEERRPRASDISGRWLCDEQACLNFYRDYFAGTEDGPLFAKMREELLAKHRRLSGLQLEVADGILTVRQGGQERSSPFSDSGTAPNEIILTCERALPPFAATVQLSHEAGHLVVVHDGLGLVFRPFTD